VRRQFRVITEAAGLGNTWVPRELRHTFLSLLSAHGVPVEAIALLAGHNQTATTELFYRHQIVPALTQGAEFTVADLARCELQLWATGQRPQCDVVYEGHDLESVVARLATAPHRIVDNRSVDWEEH
jgi:Phage integrase family